MGAVKRSWSRLTSWWGRDRTKGSGPEDHHGASSTYNEMKARAQIDTTRSINNL